MLRDDFGYIVGSALGGVLVWVCGYLSHKEERDLGPTRRQMFQAPRWLIRLSGTPRHDNQLEIGAMILQVGGLLLLIVPSLMVLMKVDICIRLNVFGFIVLGLAITSICSRLLLMIVRR